MRESCHSWELHHLLKDKFALGWKNGQRVDFAAKSRTILYFLQQIFATCNSLNCCMTGSNVANKTGNITIQHGPALAKAFAFK